MTGFDALTTEIRQFVAERDWARFHDPKSLLLALVGEVGELAELFQWLPADEAAARVRAQPLADRAADELADVLIYLITLADSMEVDLVEGARDKVARNAARFPIGASDPL